MANTFWKQPRHVAKAICIQVFRSQRRSEQVCCPIQSEPRKVILQSQQVVADAQNCQANLKALFVAINIFLWLPVFVFQALEGSRKKLLERWFAGGYLAGGLRNKRTSQNSNSILFFQCQTNVHCDTKQEVNAQILIRVVPFRIAAHSIHFTSNSGSNSMIWLGIHTTERDMHKPNSH